MKFVLVSN